MVDYSTVEGYAVLLGRYAVVATVIGGGYLLFRRSKHPLPSQGKSANKSAEGRQSGKVKKHRSEDSQGGGGDQVDTSRDSNEKKRRKKHKVTKPSVDDETQPKVTLHMEDSNDDKQDNKEFARQLQNAKSGIISTSQNQGGLRIKSVKQSQAKNATGTEKSSNDNSLASSTAGADGDDDFSAADSPALEATNLQPLRHGDISDMLEVSAAGASVLRITEPAVPSQPKKDRKPAQPEKKETQKQRQNRKKAELKKASREEEEKDRLKRLEKQLRTAREAEGRTAKDGRAFVAATASQNSSAWAAPLASFTSQDESSNQGPELLDTFEPTDDGVSNTTMIRDDNRTHKDWQATLPSEEEQIRLLQEETSWNTVISKKGKKKAGQGDMGDTKGETGENGQPQALPTKSESTLIVGDPTIDLTGLQYNGKPADALLNDGEQDFAYTMAQIEDEWEVA